MKLALGTVQFGLNYGIANIEGQVSYDEAKAILDLARAGGMDTIDTAIAYGDSEQRLGEIGIQDWRVVSKLPAVPDGCRDILQWLKDSVKESLQRLKIKNLYGLLLHQPLQLMEQDGEQIYHALQQLKHDGLVQKIGVSIYSPVELDALWNRYHLDLVQAPFNILDRRLINAGWFSRLMEQGTELHVRSVFLQGLLLMTPSNRPQKFNNYLSIWNQWETWLKEAGLTPLQACIGFVLSFQEISKVIIGVDNHDQLKEILRATEGPLPHIPDELQSNDQDLLNPARWHLLA